MKIKVFIWQLEEDWLKNSLGQGFVFNAITTVVYRFC